MKYFNLIIVCLSLFSCTSEFSKGKYVIDTIHPVITLDRYEKEFDLQDFIENISYCKLETSPESLLGNIDKMMVDSSSLFILIAIPVMLYIVFPVRESLLLNSENRDADLKNT